MSFFPSPNPAKLRDVLKQNYALYQPRGGTGPALGQSPSMAAYWPSSNRQADAPLSSPRSLSWSPTLSHDLGLGSLPASKAGNRPSTLSSTNEINMNEPWASNFPTTQPSASYSEMIRKDSTLDYTDPLSTMLPATTSWESMQTDAPCWRPAYENSPCQSEYSTASHTSVLQSSPYATSESAMGTRGSPYIKLEDAMENQSPRFHSLPMATPFDQSLLVNPGQIYSSPSFPTSEGQFPESSMPPVKQERTSFRGYAHRQRPANHRSRSMQDTRFVRPEHDEKRDCMDHPNPDCVCETCGKVFQRHYNLKSHMETHDPHRDQPHACHYEGCERKFVRRTDLQRHQHSIHLKSRDFPCPMCDSSFARKDTLRRHVDDGCSKRAEVKKRTHRAARDWSVVMPTR